jgi:hypothetical protein
MQRPYKSISGLSITDCVVRNFSYEQPYTTYCPAHANSIAYPKLYFLTNMSDTTTNPESASAPVISHDSLKFGALFFALCLAVLCQALDNTIIATAIPRITDDFNSLADIGLALSPSRDKPLLTCLRGGTVLVTCLPLALFSSRTASCTTYIPLSMFF